MTPRQRKVLEAIRELTNRGVPPTYQQIADHGGYASKGHITDAVDKLVAEGLVERIAPAGRARSLRIVADERAYTISALTRLAPDQLQRLKANVEAAVARWGMDA